jgi:hypothetical protein
MRYTWVAPVPVQNAVVIPRVLFQQALGDKIVNHFLHESPTARTSPFPGQCLPIP